jgi:hypothetical protein
LYSQKVEGQAPICVEQLAVVDVDEAAGTVSVALEDVKGQSNQALLIMDAHSLSNSVLKLLQIWQMSDELQYSFGVGIDSTDLRMKDAFAVITEGLLATKAPAASDGQRFNLVHADDPHCFKFRALKKLERAGVTLCLGDKRGQSAWCLTERYNVQIQRQLSGSRLALVPRDGSIDLENRHVLELHHELQKRGWQCFVKDTQRKVKQSKDKKKHKIAEKLESALPVHEDYVAGEKKHFWLHHRAVHFHKLYYVALLMAEDNRIKLPVPHLARQKDYYKLIYGTDPTSKRCRGKFDFGGQGTKRRKRVVPAGRLMHRFQMSPTMLVKQKQNPARQSQTVAVAARAAAQAPAAIAAAIAVAVATPATAANILLRREWLPHLNLKHPSSCLAKYGKDPNGPCI